MDLFKEARWTFSDDERAFGFYEDLIQSELISPRVPRFGILTSSCRAECSFLVTYRTNPELLGYPADVASPLSLFADVGSMEFSDPCRICVEDKYTETIEELYESVPPRFSLLRRQVVRSRDALPDTPENSGARAELDDIATKLQELVDTLTKDDMVDFYKYYVARELYAELGVDGYIEAYALFGEYIGTCLSFGGWLGLKCPPSPEEIDTPTAAAHLKNHADNTWSSVSTAGAPFPFWSEADGTGYLLKPNDETGELYAVGGSGVNMSAPVDSLTSYLGYLYLQPGKQADPSSREWKEMVSTNPMYAWFMAAVTPADEELRTLPSLTFDSTNIVLPALTFIIFVYLAVCGNGNLTGTDTGSDDVDVLSAETLANSTLRWCTKYNVPNPDYPGRGEYSEQYFARMWYDMLFTSENLLDIVQGEDDPYSWTTGAGCDYQLAGERYSYTGKADSDILHNASRIVYNIDEGTSFGVVDPALLIGGAKPAIGEYDYDNPLQEVTVLQTLYASLVPDTIVDRVANCKRPGGPLEISLDDAKAVLYDWKKAMEKAWNQGWDDDSSGEVQFVSFFDDSGGVVGSTGRMLSEITLDNNTLMAISIVVIALFSALFLFSTDVIESRVLLTMIGVGLVVLSYFAGIGFSLLVNIKVRSYKSAFPTSFF